ncbi:MAG: hypothetical protein MUF42_01755 [Cytophagaceae bacterium]|jgi:hypothetical protein|nr:hypothetical protein [Cytophagaceae bacterium]
MIAGLRTSTSQWVYEHYLVYLHLCIADADCLICEEEFESIRKAALPALDIQRAKSLIKEVHTHYLYQEERERRDSIVSLAPRFLRTESVRNRVLNQLETTANKNSESEEQMMLNYIRKTIHLLN